MKRRMSTKIMLSLLRKERIHTWFDLGIFIDKFREEKPFPSIGFSGTYNEFKSEISQGAIAFITFLYSVDGVSIEIEKYTKILANLFKGVEIHYIGGKFCSESENIISSEIKKFELEEIQGFDDWTLYNNFYFNKLERGSEKYNQLIIDFWNQALLITEKLGNYIERNNIKLLYLVNICSNPGNVSLALATVFVSEYLGIPVINNNHDFYWEGGNRKNDIEQKMLKRGPRDFFFTNSHIGEFFSLIEILYPWESRSWINVNINMGQTNHLIEKSGHNPANVLEIGTAVDTNKYLNISKRKKINAFYQFEKILSRYSNTLISYSVSDVIKNKLVDSNNPRPILIGIKTKPVEKFLNENIIFLQPTRIIARKRIELGFRLIKQLFTNTSLTDRLKLTSNLKLTLLVTGPIASGHYEYFLKLIKRFSELLNVIDSSLRNRVFIAFFFSELDRKDFEQRFKEPVGIPELYNIASLVLLPSRTEGRGLPIIEATACGTPILCRRYFPKEVYSEVIGEHLPEKDRLKVIEFDGKKITSKHAEKVIERVLFLHKYTDEILHNKHAVQSRYSLNALSKNLESILKILYNQVKPNDLLYQKTKEALKRYKYINTAESHYLKQILNTNKRQYLPGYGKMAYMLNLKSLIDPSAFRVEEQQLKGYAYTYAKFLIKKNNISELKKTLTFYNAVDNIFHHCEGEVEIRHDHSFSYRHRNKIYYPYQDFTPQELTGVINMLYIDIVGPPPKKVIDESSHFFTDWNLALAQLTSSTEIAIDNRSLLIRKLQENIPVGIFPGNYVKYELEFFALQAIRSRLKLKIEDELDSDILIQNKKQLAPVFLFTQSISVGKWFTTTEIVDFIKNGNERELYLLYKHGILKVIETKQWCVGIHFVQLGDIALKALNTIHRQKGFIVSCKEDAAIMTDIVDIDKFHIGKANHPITANIMGISEGAGYIQFVPAGLRPTLSYPTPVQTAKEFNEVLQDSYFEGLKQEFGEAKLFDILRKDSEERGSPTTHVFQSLMNKTKADDSVKYDFISGVYDDGNPYNGVFAKINMKNSITNWNFITMSSIKEPKQVTEFISDFEMKSSTSAKIAWNGGYILNAELVGKLGLAESFIGSPLGLLISDKKVICPPLFNKAALLIYENGDIDIKRVSIKDGFSIFINQTKINFSKNQYNISCRPENVPCYYDLLFNEDRILAKNRIIFRMAGNVIKEVIKPGNHEYVDIIPVGITLSFPANQYNLGFDLVGKSTDISINGLAGLLHAVEAGPLLVYNGKLAIDMDVEGWKTNNSIRTQAARLDYTDMRGPKIAVGTDEWGGLIVLVINGRIRESVGATHIDMANIMIELGIKTAMGFDPGGSSTLVVDGRVLNISPYNRNYQKNIYSLKPEPRAVSNIILGYQQKKMPPSLKYEGGITTQLIRTNQRL